MFRKLLSLLLFFLLLAAPALADSADAERPETGIIISIDQDAFYAHRSSAVTCTVQYGADVFEPIQLYDHTDRLLTEVENDGSGLSEVTLWLRPQSAGEGYLYAVSSDFESEKCPYTVLETVQVSAQMVDTLENVCTDIISMLETQNITDADSAEATSAVLALLATDARIESYGENNGNILFRTTDGLTGFYGFHATDDLIFGDEDDSVFTSLPRAFKQYEKGELSADTVVASEIPITNPNILYVAPQTGDDVIDWGRSIFPGRLRELAGTLDYSYTGALGSAGIDRLIDGDITDCGLLVLMGHGKPLLCPGGNMLTIKLGHFSDEQLARVQDLLWEPYDYLNLNQYHQEVEGDEKTIHQYYVNDDTMHLLFGVSQNSAGNYAFQMVATRNFLEFVLADKKFDNTVVYMVVCYAASDSELRSFLMDRGASAVIGTTAPLDGFISLCMLEELCNMTVKQADGTYLTLQEAVNNVDATPTEELIYEFYDSLLPLKLTKETDREKFLTDLLISHNEEQLYNQIMVYTRTAKTMDRVWLGTGSLEGIVTDELDRPLPEAEIRLYRWLDHSFRQMPDAETVLKTDENGRYCFENLPYGRYYVAAEKDSLPGGVGVSVDEANKKADNIVLSPLKLFYDYLREVVVPEIGLVPEAACTGPFNEYPNPWENFWEGVIAQTDGLFSAAVNDFDFDGKYEMLTVTIPERTADQIIAEDIYMTFDLRLYQIIDGQVQQTDFYPNAVKMSGKNALEQDNMRVHLVSWDNATYVFTRSFFTSGNSYDGAHSTHLTIRDGKFVETNYLPVLQYNFFMPDGSSLTLTKLDDVYASKADLAAMNPGDLLCSWNFDYYERYFNPNRNRYETTGNYIDRADDYSHLHAIIREEMDPVLYIPMTVLATPVPTKAPDELAMEAMIRERKENVAAAVEAIAPDPNYDADRYRVTVSSYKTGEMSQLMVFGPGYGDPAVLMAKFVAAINTPGLGLDADIIAALSAFDYENEWSINIDGYDLSLGGTPDGDDVLNLIWPH